MTIRAVNVGFTILVCAIAQIIPTAFAHAASCTITISPTTIQKGQSATLSWLAQESGAISPYIGGVNKEGSLVIYPEATAVYGFYSHYDGVSPPECAATITVAALAANQTPPPPSPPPPDSFCSISLSPTTIQKGQSATLSWSAQDSGSIPGIGGVARSGSVVVNPSVTTDYAMYKKYDGILPANCSARLVVTTSVTPPPPPPAPPPVSSSFCSISVTPSTIVQGTSATLSWSAKDSGAIPGIGGVSKSGSISVSPNTTTQYAMYEKYDGVLPPSCSATLAVTPRAECPVLPRTLSLGMRGDDVLLLQKFLITQGLLDTDSATGYFGTLTQAAVQAFQTKKGIVSSGTPETTGWGTVGAQTRSAIAAACAQSLPKEVSGFQCTAHTFSPSITVTHDGQVIEHMSISANGAPGINVNGYSNVVIRDVSIHHRNSQGIELNHANNITIQNVDIINDGAPARGVDTVSGDDFNIDCNDSSGISVSDARVSDGVMGIYLFRCPGAHLQRIEGHNNRMFGDGRGGFVQFNQSDNGTLEDFSIENDPAIAENVDTLNVYNSGNITIRRGLLDGNNSPRERNGGSVVIDTDSHDVLVEDVDVTHAALSCFVVWGANGSNRNITFSRTGCRDNLTSRPDGQLVTFVGGWAVHPDAVNPAIRSSKYFNIPTGHEVIAYSNLVNLDLQKSDFTLRAPHRVQYCTVASADNVSQANLANAFTALESALKAFFKKIK